MIDNITIKWYGEQYTSDEPIMYSDPPEISYIKNDNGMTYKLIKYNDGSYVLQGCDYDPTSYKTILVSEVVQRTRIVQETEERLMDYIYNLDKFFIKENVTYIYELVREKAYEVSDIVLDEGLVNDYVLLDANREMVVDEIISSIDFEELYEIIDNIADTSNSLEDFFRETGLSIEDFI